MSDLSYQLSSSGESSLLDEGEPVGKKTRKTVNSKSKCQKASQDLSKAKKTKPQRSNVKTRNHNKFFEKRKNASCVENDDDDDDDWMMDAQRNSQEKNRRKESPNKSASEPGDASLSQLADDISVRKLAQDMHELKELVLGIKKQIFKVEILIKSRKGHGNTLSDGEEEGFKDVLRRYKLPIASKEDLDGLEVKLKCATDRKILV